MRETYRSKLPTHSFFTPRILPSLRQLSLFPGEFSDQLRCPISRISDLYSIAPQLHHLSLPDWHEANMTPLLLKCENLISFETKGNHRISTTHHGKPLIGLRIKRDYQSPREPILAVVKSAFLIGLIDSRSTVFIVSSQEEGIDELKDWAESVHVALELKEGAVPFQERPPIREEADASIGFADWALKAAIERGVVNELEYRR